MQKGYKRTGKAIAVLHFFIGLIVVAIFLVAAYFCLEKMDYSNRINPDTTVRAYVEMTASPDDFGLGAGGSFDGTEGSDPNGGDQNSEIVDLLPTPSPTPDATPEPTPEPVLTPEPTPIMTPTPTPEPTPTPVPTPEPTRISSDLLSKSRTRGFKVPAASSEAMAGLTKIYVSEPNNRTFADITGYAYINSADSDAAKTKAFLIITPADGNGAIAYQSKMTPGVSGVTHDGALCQNPANADFEVILKVSDFKDGVYKFGVVLQYKNGRKDAYTYYEFPDTMTVASGAISEVSSAAAATIAAPDAAAAMVPDGAAGDASLVDGVVDTGAVAGEDFGAAGESFGAEMDDLQGTAFGDGNPAEGGADEFGEDADAFGEDADAFGEDADAFGADADAFGEDADAFGGDADAFGTDDADASMSVG